MSSSASKCEWRAKMCASNSRCCSVNRCGFSRLARYSRNLSSGDSDILMVGSDMASLHERKITLDRLACLFVVQASRLPKLSRRDACTTKRQHQTDGESTAIIAN